MSHKNVEILQNLSQVFNEGGFRSAKASELFDADFIFEEPPEQPAPRVAHGVEAAAEIYGQFDEAWEEHRSEPVEFRVIDDDRVLVLSVEHFKGRDGIEITQPCGTIFTLRDGRITRMQSFWERSNALEAAALPPSTIQAPPE